MRLLLGSGGFRTEERKSLLVEQMRKHFENVSALLFLPYALADHDGYVEMLYQKGLDAGYRLDGIHTHQDPRAAVESAEAIFIGGGNSFRLLTDLYRFDLLEPIRRKVRENGIPYLGISAGTNVACPTIQTTNDMPITTPPSFNALGLVSFQVNPHYFQGQTHVKVGDGYEEHFGETRDERIREFHEMNATPVVGLWEGGILVVHDQQVTLLGTSARLFLQGKDPRDFPPLSVLNAEW